MKKSIIFSMTAALTLSALTPVVSIAAENNAVSEYAKPGLYNVKTGEVVLTNSFIDLKTSEKVKFLTDENYYFADGIGGAIKALHIVTSSDSTLESKIVLQTDVEKEFNVKLTADGRVIFLSTEDASNALQNAINKAKDQLDKLTEEQKQAVENTIKEAEEALKNANATAEDLKGALERLNQAIENATAADPAVKAAKDAVKLAQETRKKEDIDKAQELVNKLEDGPLKVELQGILDSISSGTVDLSGLQEVIQSTEQLLATSSDHYTPESIKALELALQKAKIVHQQYEGKAFSEEAQLAVKREVAELGKALDALVEMDKLIFRPTEETQKTSPLFIDPVVTNLEDRQKTSGGVLGLDIGILELGLISASQINQISESDRHSLEVKEGTTVSGTATVAIHTVLGGHAFKIFVMKENADGDYVKVATYEGSSGGALGIAVPTEIDLGTLEEGNYEIILSVEEGLSVVQVIPFKLINLVENDYTQVSTEESIVTGNVLKGQNLDKDDHLIVMDVKEKDAKTSQNVGIQGLDLEGKYGKLHINKNGTYEYRPASNRNNVGEVEVFEFTMKDTSDNQSVKGTLNIQLESASK